MPGVDPEAPGALSALDTQALLEGLGDAVVVADDAHRIVYVNSACERLLGWPRGELVGQTLTVIVPPRFRDAHVTAYARYLTTHEARLIGQGPVRVPALRRDGSELEIELTLSAQRLGDRELFVGSLRDLRDRVRLEREQALSRYLATSREITARLALAGRAGTLAEAAPIVLATVGTALDWQVGGVWEVVEDRFRAVAGWAADGYAAAAEELISDRVSFAPGEGLPGRVAEHGQPAWIHDIGDDPNFTRAEAAARYGLRSGFGFPVLVEGRVHGVIEFFAADTRPPEAALMATMATVGAELGRFLERERVRAHLVGLAETLQASLLPARLPDVPHVEVAAAYHAAAGEGQIGGDFYDVFALTDERWGVAIGDVCGRGPRAAALTALARYTLRAAARTNEDPAGVLEVLNDAVITEMDARGDDESFLTAVYLTLTPDAGGGVVEVANGGHPVPLLVRDGVATPVCDGGTLLGLMPGAAFACARVVLRPGDLLVLVTDGVVEARSPDGRQLGEDGLAAVVAGVSGGTAGEAVAAVEAAVTAHAAERGHHDDVAVVALRALG